MQGLSAGPGLHSQTVSFGADESTEAEAEADGGGVAVRVEISRVPVDSGRAV